MKKYVLDLTVCSIEQLSPKHVLLRLTHEQPLPEMLPGQFVEVRVDGSPTTFLRRPISINFVDKKNNELWRFLCRQPQLTVALVCYKLEARIKPLRSEYNPCPSFMLV